MGGLGRRHPERASGVGPSGPTEREGGLVDIHIIGRAGSDKWPIILIELAVNLASRPVMVPPARTRRR